MENIGSGMGLHRVIIESRKSINITGIKKIIWFDDKEFLVDSNMGQMLIKGSELEMTKLDTVEGVVHIKGKIDGYNYFEGKGKNKEESFMAKLFK